MGGSWERPAVAPDDTLPVEGVLVPARLVESLRFCCLMPCGVENNLPSDCSGSGL